MYGQMHHKRIAHYFNARTGMIYRAPLSNTRSQRNAQHLRISFAHVDSAADESHGTGTMYRAPYEAQRNSL